MAAAAAAVALASAFALASFAAEIKACALASISADSNRALAFAEIAAASSAVFGVRGIGRPREVNTGEPGGQLVSSMVRGTPRKEEDAEAGRVVPADEVLGAVEDAKAGLALTVGGKVGKIGNVIGGGGAAAAPTVPVGEVGGEAIIPGGHEVHSHGLENIIIILAWAIGSMVFMLKGAAEAGAACPGAGVDDLAGAEEAMVAGPPTSNSEAPTPPEEPVAIGVGMTLGITFGMTLGIALCIAFGVSTLKLDLVPGGDNRRRMGWG